MSFNMEEVFLGTHYKGSTAGFTGERGFGKTHMAVCLMTAGLAYRMKVVTNVVFQQKLNNGITCPSCHGLGYWKSQYKSKIECTDCSGYGKKWKWRQKTPKGITFIEYASEFFREIARILTEEPCIIMNFWDEFQNSALDHHAKSDGLTKFLNVIQGDQRKWNLANVLSTPVHENYTAGIRRFMKWEYFKSTQLTREYNKRWGTDHDLKKGMIFLRHVNKKGMKKIVVSEGPFNRSWDKVRVGEIVFDHESSARLSMCSYRHEGFNLKWLLSIYAGKPKAIFPELVYRAFQDIECGQQPGVVEITAEHIANEIIENTGGWICQRIHSKNEKEWIKLTQESVRHMAGLSVRKIGELWPEWERQGLIIPEHEFFTEDKEVSRR